MNSQLNRRQRLRYAAGLGLSAGAFALLQGCGILPAATPTPAKIPPALDEVGYGYTT